MNHMDTYVNYGKQEYCSSTIITGSLYISNRLFCKYLKYSRAGYDGPNIVKLPIWTETFFLKLMLAECF